MNKSIRIIVALILTILLVGGLVYFFTTQKDEIPKEEPIVEELVLEEPIVEESKEPICENGMDYFEEAAEFWTLIDPIESADKGRKYSLSGMGIEFWIPNEHQEYNAFQSSENWIIFNKTTDPGCTGFGDVMNPGISKVTDEEIEDLYQNNMEELAQYIVESGDSTFPNFTASYYVEKYLGGNNIVSYEFELEDQFYSAAHLACREYCDEWSIDQGDLLLGVLESLALTAE